MYRQGQPSSIYHHQSVVPISPMKKQFDLPVEYVEAHSPRHRGYRVIAVPLVIPTGNPDTEEISKSDLCSVVNDVLVVQRSRGVVKSEGAQGCDVGHFDSP